MGLLYLYNTRQLDVHVLSRARKIFKDVDIIISCVTEVFKMTFTAMS